MNIIDKIKQFFNRFNRDERKALPSGAQLTNWQTSSETVLCDSKKGIISPIEALRRNYELGQLELELEKRVEEYVREIRGAITTWVDSKSEYENGLKRYVDIEEALEYLSDIIESYTDAKIVTNKFDYNNVDIEPEEIILFINYLKNSSQKKEHTEVLSTKEQELFDLLTVQQQQAFISLGSYGRFILMKDLQDNPSNIKTILNAISIYEKRKIAKEDIKYDEYKSYIDTKERKRVYRAFTRMEKK